MKGVWIALAALLGWGSLQAQADSTQSKKITIVYGGNFTKDESLRPGASIFSRDTRQVQFEHQGADLWCDFALLYQKENRLEAIGNVRMKQGDSVLMTSGFVEYDGNLKQAKAFENVRLTNRSNVLTTDTLLFDRERQEAFYEHHGRIVDSVNTLTSRVGRYYLIPKKYQFEDSVRINNPDYTVESARLDYYTLSKNAYMYGPSRITGETYMMYFERGFYDTKIEQGYGIKNTEIHYSNRIIEGDSVYFDKATSFASATNNIVVTDTINNGVIRAHYAEVHREQDSLFATRRAVSVSLVEQDSLYMHGDTLMVTGKPDARILRAYRNARFYKTDLSGKCDSIHFDQTTGITQLIRNPVLWNLENQMTGDSIHLISNLETEKLDSLKVIRNAFIISEDTVGHRGYNQAKGRDLFGKFIENELRLVDLVGNTEVVYYMYDDDGKLIGIDKTKCSSIRLALAQSDIEEITFYTDPDGTIYPEADFPQGQRQLDGFIWRGEERIRSKDDLFDAEDNNLVLPRIRGVDEPIDREEELPEAPTTPNPGALKPQKALRPKPPKANPRES
ncbi:OstA-like protein [Robiginitalea sediminis]|uniref:OstA-like protein n=1 Tax=Robiginitalea sediminis TaxID=1982593 RepID=UPI003743B3FF